MDVDESGEFAPELHRISAQVGPGKWAYQYLLVGDDEWVWIDAGTSSSPANFLIPYVKRQGLKPPSRMMVLATHADVDHAGGIAALRSYWPHLVVGAHHDDAPWVENPRRLIQERYETPKKTYGMGLGDERLEEMQVEGGHGATVDLTFVGGERFNVGQWELDVHHTPGHTPGHIVLLARNTGFIFVGDAVLMEGPCSPDGQPSPPAYFDRVAYVRSLQQIRALCPDVIFSGHFPPIQGHEVSVAIARSLETVDTIRLAVHRALEALGQGTVTELVEFASAHLQLWPKNQAVRLATPVIAELEAGVRSGFIQCTKIADHTVFSL